MPSREVAARLVLQRAILECLTDANKQLRDEVALELQPGDAQAVNAITGGRLGRVRMDKPRTSTRLVDEAKFVAWCKQHNPDGLELRARPALVEAIRKAGGVVVDRETGEVTEIPGFETVTAAQGSLVVEMTDLARSSAATMLSGLLTPSIPTGLTDDEGRTIRPERACSALHVIPRAHPVEGTPHHGE